MPSVKATVKTEALPVKRSRGRPRKIAPASATTAALKRKAVEPEEGAILKKVKEEAVVQRPLRPKRTAAVKLEPKAESVSATIKKERKVKKELAANSVSKVKRVVKPKKQPKEMKPAKTKKVVKKVIKKEPKPMRQIKSRIIYKLPPEASIYLDDAMRGRILRAMKQRMFVMSRELSPQDDTIENFEVIGSIGNTYTVTIGNVISCSCMDHIIRRTHCKHILMVLLKVYRLGLDSPMFQSLRTSNEDRLRARSGGRNVDHSVLVPTAIREKILKLTTGHSEAHSTEQVNERRPLDTSDCPICFEEFEQAKINLIDYCKVCGNNIHQECFNMWKASKGRDVTCVYCRAQWVSPNANNGATKKSARQLDSAHRFEGRANFAQELGMERKRDTSTYKTYRGYQLSFEGE
ncbi:Elongation of fatty acids protein 2 [Mucor velutinosus]|uniref:Elongation of fatty acids protein 2 n=1 Tax=Mucor velutinosus TaxID=708070 RepID=A0AAN7DQL9_9FUNG|nr:Elongation of fatty acids protein 2 [Mucor velutinosus]